MKLRHLLWLATAVCALAGCGRSSPPTRLDQIKELLAEKRHDEALQICESMLQENPQDYDALYLRGEVHRAESQLDDAIQDFTDAIATDPERPDAYYLRAKVYQAKGEKHRVQAELHEQNEEFDLQKTERDAFLHFLDLQVADDQLARSKDPTYGLAYTNDGPPIMDLQSLTGGQDEQEPELTAEPAGAEPNANADGPRDEEGTTSPQVATETPKTPYQKMQEEMAAGSEQANSTEQKSGDDLADIPTPPAPPELDLGPLPNDRDAKPLDAPPPQVYRFGIQGQGLPSVTPFRPQQATTGIRSGDALPPAQGRFYLQQQAPGRAGWPPTQRPPTTGITSNDATTPSADSRFTSQRSGPVGMIGLGSNLPFGPRIATPGELQNQSPAAAPIWGTAPSAGLNARPAVGPNWGTGNVPGTPSGLPGAIPTSPKGTPKFAPQLSDPDFTPFVPVPTGLPSVE